MSLTATAKGGSERRSRGTWRPRGLTREEWRNLRLDVGYFLTQKAQAQRLFPYPTANDRFAGTLSWRF